MSNNNGVNEKMTYVKKVNKLFKNGLSFIQIICTSF